MDFGALVQSLGLPVATAAFFIWRDYQNSKEHKQDLKDIAIKSVQAIDAGTEAIKDSTEQMKLNNTALSENSNILSVTNSVLSNMKGRQQNELGRGN